MKRTPLRKVSKKRQRESTIYRELCKEHLHAHPFCQIYITRHCLDEAAVIKNNGAYFEPVSSGSQIRMIVPLADQIHHRKGRGKYYLDKRWFFSACHNQHWWAHHEDPKEARRIGVHVDRNVPDPTDA